jgi:hypothetical protein
VGLFVAGSLLGGPGVVWAGMPEPTTLVLEELPRMRLHSISFFLLGFFLSALLIQIVWNQARKDFTFLPRLSYLRAVGLVTLWGLLFVLVLTMISGARELMTPGAWESDGITYRLARKAGPAPDEAGDAARKEKMERLKEALWQYARTHSGHFPGNRHDAAIPEELWRLPDSSGMRYVYAGGEATLFDGVPVAYEPDVYSGDRWVLFSDGSLRQLSTEELRQTLAVGKKP